MLLVHVATTSRWGLVTVGVHVWYSYGTIEWTGGPAAEQCFHKTRFTETNIITHSV